MEFCLKESEENFFKVSLLDLFVLCEQSRRKGQRSNFFTFWKRLRIVNKDKIFPIEIDIFQREKFQTAGRLVIRRPCEVVSAENFQSDRLGYVSRTNQIAALGYISRTNQSAVFVLWFERC